MLHGVDFYDHFGHFVQTAHKFYLQYEEAKFIVISFYKANISMNLWIYLLQTIMIQQPQHK